MIGFIFLSLFGIVGLLLFYGFKLLSKYQLVRNIPRSKIRSLAMGIAEIGGTVVSEQIIHAPFSQTPCVYCKYTIEQYEEHTERDSDGKTKTHREWRTIASGEGAVPFYVQDETGKVLVQPSGAEFNVDCKKIFRDDGGTDINGLLRALKNFSESNTAQMIPPSIKLTETNSSFGFMVGDRRYSEYFICPDNPVYVLGTAANRADVAGDTFIAKGTNEPTFIISDKEEKKLMKNLKLQMLLCFIFGGLLVVIAVSGAVILWNFSQLTFTFP